MFVFIGQLFVTFALSACAAWFLGGTLYVIVGVISALVVGGCLLGVPGKRDLDDDDGFIGFAWRDVLAALGFGVFLGAQWPALPIIVAWGVSRRRAEAAASRTSTLPDS